MTEIRSHALIALGSNLPSSVGNSVQTLGSTLNLLCKRGMTLCAISRFYETPCFPAGAGPDYVNAAVSVSYQGSAKQILSLLHEIEHHFGREREQRWGMRTLDLDVIAVGQTILPDVDTQRHWMNLPSELQKQQAPGQLILPHPRVQDRAFVLVPLADIAPDWVHPVLNKSVIEMCRELPAKDVAEVRPL